MKKTLVLIVFILSMHGYIKVSAQCSISYSNTSSQCPNTGTFVNYLALQNYNTPCKVINVDGFLTSSAGAQLNATITSTTTSIGVNWLTAGSHYIDYKCPCETNNRTQTVIINTTTVSPGTISDVTICAGGTATLTANNISGGNVLRWETKLPADPWSSASIISHTTNVLPSGYIDNTTTKNYRVVVGNNCISSVYAYATVTVNSLSAPPVPTNGDITSSCGQIIAIETSTNYAAGYTIKHHYYDGAGTPLTAPITATNPFTATVYYSQFNPGPFASPKTFQVEAEVVGTGGCPSQFSGRKTFTYTINSSPQPPSGIQIYQGSTQITSINVCAGEAITLQQVNGTSNYKWYNSGGSLIGSTSTLSNYVPTAGGTYYAEATWNSPCGGSTTLQGSFQVNLNTPNLTVPDPGSPFCTGSTPTFAANLSAGASNIAYQWNLSNGSTGNSSNFTLPADLSAGPYTLSWNVQADFIGQCQTRKTFTDQRTFQLNQRPAAPPTPANTDITTSCGQIIEIETSTNYAAGYTIKHHYYDGSGTPLTAPIVATNPFSATVYNSQFNPGPFASPKTFQVEAEVVGAGGCPSQFSGRKTFTYTINTPPQPPSGLQIYQGSTQITSINVCAGEAITLQQVNGTSNYKWYNSGGSLIGSASTLSNYLPPAGGTYTVTATWTSSCGGDVPLQSSFQVNVNTPGVSISNPGSSFCFGQTPGFSAVTSPAGASNITYQWNLSDGTVGSGPTFNLPGNLAANDYTLNCTVTASFNGVCQTQQTLNTTKAIQIKSSPNMPAVYGSTRFGAGLLTLTASEIFPLPTYKWYTSTGVISGSTYTTPSEIMSSQANYATVSAIAANGCEGPVRQVDITILNMPQIVFEGPGYIPVNGTTTLKTAESYQYYTWKNSVGVNFGDASSIIVNTPDKYEVTVFQSGASASVFVNVGDNIGNQATNYIAVTSIQKEGVYDEAQISLLPIGDRSQVIEYFDGLGRPMQKIITMGSPGKKDVVQPVVYDVLGRENKKYLPFVPEENTGRYKDNNSIIDADTEDYTGIAADFYNSPGNKIADDQDKPFSQTIFEPSPLNRILKQGAPGEMWQPDQNISSMNDYSIKKKYEANNEKEVFLFIYSSTTGDLRLDNDPEKRHYEMNMLFANKTYDEHNNEVIEFTDKEGRVVCKKVQYDSEGSVRKYASTYYIYDDLGNLVVVLPPEAVKAIVSSVQE